MTKVNIGTPFFTAFIPDPQLEWQMSRAEKYCLINLLETIKPQVSIEIGTYKGGSLQVISKQSEKVYSIDISAAPKSFLQNKFSNVDFRVAQAHDVLHEIFKEIENSGKRLEFILIDGDHTKKGVSGDLNKVLSYPHKNPLTIIMHDSFNPQCRKGIKSVNYAQYPAVNYVELDYITGSFWHNDTYREMWGGFAIIKTDPHQPNKDVRINESQKHLFESTRMVSVHLFKDYLGFLAPVKQALYRKLGKAGKTAMYDNFD